jgi:beta-glucanase (GH16 family)
MLMLKRWIAGAGCVGLLLTAWLLPRASGEMPRKSADDYVLVWSDAFDREGALNPKDWEFEKGFVRNQELQWYQPANAVCAHGELVIEARREQVANPNFEEGSKRWQMSRKSSEYTSASVTTRGHHAWLYGRFEINARIDTSSGSWPAFWMLGTSRQWPACGEVDIMEYYRKMVLANFAWGATARDIVWNSKKKPLESFKDPEWSAKFHVWRMDWDKDAMSLYVDSELVNRQDLAKTVNGGNANDNPFHRPMYLILNEAIGGQQGGDPAKSSFPMKFEVRYVKVWQRPADIAATQAGK